VLLIILSLLSDFSVVTVAVAVVVIAGGKRKRKTLVNPLCLHERGKQKVHI